jgi:hypothetical protein
MEWHNWPTCREALTRFGRSFLGPTNFKFNIEVPDNPMARQAIGSTNFAMREINVNPEAVNATLADRPPQEQFEAALGVIAHEVGHGRYTSSDPALLQGDVGHLFNIIEDDRIERIMGGKYGIVRKPLRRASQCILKRNTQGLRENQLALGQPDAKFCSSDVKTDVADYLLRKLIATRAGQPEVLADSELHPNNQPIWDQVWPLVQKAVVADTSEECYEYSKQVWELIKPDEEEGDADGAQWAAPTGKQGTAPPDGGGEAGDREVEQPPQKRWNPEEKDEKDGASPPTPQQAVDPDTGADKMHTNKVGRKIAVEIPTGEVEPSVGASDDQVVPTNVAPFEKLERQARPLANKLANQLQLPVIHSPQAYAERGSKLSLRAAISTRFEQPFLADANPMPDGQQLAFAWCTDVSASMTGMNAQMALTASAMLHMVCCEFDIWHINWTFGELHYVITPSMSEEEGLARLASLTFSSATTVGHALGRALTSLRERPEAVKVCFVIHDGAPADPGVVAELVNDARADGIEVVGVGLRLGQYITEMERMFGEDDFLDCQSPSELPTKLGNAVNELHKIANQRHASMRVGV